MMYLRFTSRKISKVEELLEIKMAEIRTVRRSKRLCSLSNKLKEHACREFMQSDVIRF